MEFEYSWGVARTVVFAVPIVDDTDLAATGDWTPVTGDAKISKDSGNVANVGTLPAAIGGTGSVVWEQDLSATELEAEYVIIQYVDAAIENQTLVGYCKDAGKVEYYKVNTTNVTPTTSLFQGDRGLGRTEEATADHFNSRNILWMTGTLQGSMTVIEDYEQANTRGQFTVTTMVGAAASGDIFIVL